MSAAEIGLLFGRGTYGLAKHIPLMMRPLEISQVR